MDQDVEEYKLKPGTVWNIFRKAKFVLFVNLVQKSDGVQRS